MRRQADRPARSAHAGDEERPEEDVAPRLDDAIEQGATLAEEGGVFGEAIGSGAVLVTGSVITVGEARSMLKPRERRA